MVFALGADAGEVAERTDWQRVFRTRGIAMQQHPGNENRFAVVQSGDGDGKADVGEGYADGGPQRAGIEQAKGMLMLIYGMDASAAFDLLRWRSQETNVKLKLLARQVAADFVALSGSEKLPPRSAYDNLILTAHLRVSGDVESGDA